MCCVLGCHINRVLSILADKQYLVNIYIYYRYIYVLYSMCVRLSASIVLKAAAVYNPFSGWKLYLCYSYCFHCIICMDIKTRSTCRCIVQRLDSNIVQLGLKYWSAFLKEIECIKPLMLKVDQRDRGRRPDLQQFGYPLDKKDCKSKISS